MAGLSGRPTGDSSTGHRMANPWEMLRHPYRAIRIPPIHMTFRGIGRIVIRRLSRYPNDHM
jgi:hypothetical protein